MFDFTLENGKHQFKTGLYCLIATIIFSVIFAILATTITDQKALLAIVIIFGIILGGLTIVTGIKLIFGIVVYHAERISHATERGKSSTSNETSGKTRFPHFGDDEDKNNKTKCPRCGCKIKNGDKFCPECGMRIE